MENSENEILNERLKKLSCLYTIAKMTLDSTKKFDEVIADIVQYIPKAWKYGTAVSTFIIRYLNFPRRLFGKGISFAGETGK